MNLKNLKKLNIHIVGLSGVEGSTITEFFWNNGITNITVHDFCEESEFIKNFMKFNSKLPTEERKNRLTIFKDPNLQKHFKKKYLEGIEKADLIFVGQAWYKYEFNFPKLQNAQEKGIPLRTIINLYLDLFPGTTIGITGSNGKTTTSSLLHHILKKLHSESTYISGNIDSETQALNQILNASQNDLLVLEVSNRQLKLLGDSHTDLAIITNITENHLDEHDDLAEYAHTKLKLCQNAQAFLNNEDPATKEYATKIQKPIWFNNEEILNEFELEKSDLQIPGPHNLENLYAVLHVIKHLKENNKLNFINADLKKAVQSFKGVTKRLEILGESNGVTIVNDLSSTTPESTIKAIEAFPDAKFSLVLGCNDKGGSYKELIEKLKELTGNQTIQKIFTLPGSIRKIIEDVGINTVHAENFEEIAAQTNPELGEYLIISPSGEKVISVHLQGTSLKKIFSI